MEVIALGKPLLRSLCLMFFALLGMTLTVSAVEPERGFEPWQKVFENGLVFSMTSDGGFLYQGEELVYAVNALFDYENIFFSEDRMSFVGIWQPRIFLDRVMDGQSPREMPGNAFIFQYGNEIGSYEITDFAYYSENNHLRIITLDRYEIIFDLSSTSILSQRNMRFPYGILIGVGALVVSLAFLFFIKRKSYLKRNIASFLVVLSLLFLVGCTRTTFDNNYFREYRSFLDYSLGDFRFIEERTGRDLQGELQFGMRSYRFRVWELEYDRQNGEIGA